MNYLGMHAQTGHFLSENDHLRQSINDILFTPIGSRVMRRQYGSLLAQLIDQPKNAALRLKIMSTCYLALLQWEPRIRLQSIDYKQEKPNEFHDVNDPNTPAKAHIVISAVVLRSGKNITFSFPTR